MIENETIMPAKYHMLIRDILFNESSKCIIGKIIKNGEGVKLHKVGDIILYTNHFGIIIKNNTRLISDHSPFRMICGIINKINLLILYIKAKIGVGKWRLIVRED